MSMVTQRLMMQKRALCSLTKRAHFLVKEHLLWEEEEEEEEEEEKEEEEEEFLTNGHEDEDRLLDKLSFFESFHFSSKQKDGGEALIEADPEPDTEQTPL